MYRITLLRYQENLLEYSYCVTLLCLLVNIKGIN